MKTLQLFFALAICSLHHSFAQQQRLQFIYYVKQTDDLFTYYFSDMFSVDDWYRNRFQIKQQFVQLLAKEGQILNKHEIKEGITAQPIYDLYKAIGHIGFIVKQDQYHFELKQNLRPLNKRKTFNNTTKTLFLNRTISERDF